MQFFTRKRRQAPAIIIISLIDILIVLLIFLMVTTTFRQRPAVKLTLPEAKSARKGVTDETLVVTVAKEPPFFYFKTKPVPLERLPELLRTEAKSRPDMKVTVDADKGAILDHALKVIDAAREAGLEAVTLSTREPARTK